ncbi:MAG: YetF domain-containing protein [Cyanobacteria bacterium P01_A01_bin.84]
MTINLIGNVINEILGLQVDKLSVWQMSARAVVVYIVALVIVRLGGDKRLLGKHATFDVILSIIFGATLSRAINGSAPFFPTLGAGVVLIGIHWLFATVAVRINSFEALIKGRPIVLIRDGQINPIAMRKARITQEDLKSSLRLKAKTNDSSSVKIARLETSGNISIIPEKESPQIVEVDVDSGVQKIRILLQ